MPARKGEDLRQSPYTNDEVHNRRFLVGHLARHGGDARAAMHAAMRLGAMGDEGRGNPGKSWWTFVAAECAGLHAQDVLAGRTRRTRGAA